MLISELKPGLPVYYGHCRELVHVVRVTANSRVRVRQETEGGVRYRTVTAAKLHPNKS